MLVTLIYKNGTTETKWLSRRDILKMPIDERAVVLRDQVEEFLKQHPNYCEDVVG